MNAKNLSKKGALFCFIAVSAFTTTNLLAQSNLQKEQVQTNAFDVPKTLTGNTAKMSAFDVDFTQAAERSVNGVVHVKTKIMQKQQSLAIPQDPFFQYFFGQPQLQLQPQQAQPILSSGSGVIISADGYIVTNNHVVNDADEIEVTLNDNRTFKATVIGKDPNTDLALIKIDAKDLTVIPFGNSDNLKIGEWVLAIGNPFNLTSTVTAGIVSAKARSINIITSDMKIEAFIQTDAAVNPGNSGGALVNIRGELVGINTAIASQTGSYAGYSFAIPVSIVEKVVADLKQFGDVQRAILGVSISDITDELAKDKNLKTMEGAYVKKVSDNSAAKTAGIKEGDIIIQVNDVKVKSVAELQEQIGRHSPGDKVSISVLRDEKIKTFDIELKNKKGSTDIIKNVGLETLGASFEELNEKQKATLKIPNGVQVVQVTKNGKFAKNGMQKDFIILKINNKPITTVSDIENAIKTVQNSLDSDNALFISGMYPNGKAAYFAINLKD
jgi:Do/DeqQ family serine protease